MRVLHVDYENKTQEIMSNCIDIIHSLFRVSIRLNGVLIIDRKGDKIFELKIRENKIEVEK